MESKFKTGSSGQYLVPGSIRLRFDHQAVWSQS